MVASAAEVQGGSVASVEIGAGRFAQLGRTLELWIPGGFLILIVLACFVWPEIYNLPSPIQGDLNRILAPPLSPGHVFGTDQLGNDIFSRILYGGRASLEVGFGSTFLGLLLGGTLGAFAALKGGAIETVIMRILEILLAFPGLVLAICVATYLGPSVLHLIWAISFFSIPAFARLARANTLRLREQTFVQASRLTGVNDRSILVRHIVPNVIATLMTYSLLVVGITIIVEAALSFLGLGIRPPNPSWGNMIQVGQSQMTTSPDLLLIPSAFLFATVLALNLVGDALRERWRE